MTLSVRSSDMFEKVSDIQMETGRAIMKYMMANGLSSEFQVTTYKNVYTLSLKTINGTGKDLVINDRKETMTMYGIDVLELIAILEYIESINV